MLVANLNAIYRSVCVIIKKWCMVLQDVYSRDWLHGHRVYVMINVFFGPLSSVCASPQFRSFLEVLLLLHSLAGGQGPL